MWQYCWNVTGSHKQCQNRADIITGEEQSTDGNVSVEGRANIIARGFWWHR